ncbi:MAG: HAD family phosphatase [Candidatus Micrarchaeaceae archaeon]
MSIPLPKKLMSFLANRPISLSKAPSNIIFDVGGVIIKYDNSDYYSNYLAKKTGLDAKEIRRRIESRLLPLFAVAQISKAEFYKGVAKAVGISEKGVKWTDYYAKHAKINEQTINTIKRLKHKYTIAYFSNVDTAMYARMREKLNPYAALFDFKFASCELRAAKPDAAAFRTVLKKMGARASDTLFIDDCAEYVQGARTIGMNAILFKDNNSLSKELERMGVL